MTKQQKDRLVMILCGGFTLTLFALLGVLALLQQRPYEFEGSEALAERLQSWQPRTASKGEPHPVDGKILYYSIDCLKLMESVGTENAKRRFLKSDVQRAEDVGCVAALVYDQSVESRYTNGAAAYRIECTVYILDKDTLEILATDVVRGGKPPSTTSGGDRRGSQPSLGDCRGAAERLVEKLGR